MKRTKIRKKTWLGRPGEVYELLLSDNSLGKRVSVHRWIDTNHVEIRIIEGDGRHKGFKEYSRFDLINPREEDIQQAINQLLSQLNIDESAFNKTNLN